MCDEELLAGGEAHEDHGKVRDREPKVLPKRCSIWSQRRPAWFRSRRRTPASQGRECGIQTLTKAKQPPRSGSVLRPLARHNTWRLMPTTCPTGARGATPAGNCGGVHHRQPASSQPQTLGWGWAAGLGSSGLPPSLATSRDEPAPLQEGNGLGSEGRDAGGAMWWLG